MSEWYYAVDGQQQGPVSLDELLGLFESQQLQQSTTQVWKSGFESWVSASAVPELTRPASQVPTQVSVSAPEQNPYAAPSVEQPVYQGNTSSLEIPPIPSQPDIGDAISKSWKFLMNNMGLLVGATFIYGLIYIVSSAGTELLAAAIDGNAVGAETFSNDAIYASDYNSGLGAALGGLIDMVVTTYLGLGILSLYLNLMRGRTAEISDLFSQGSRVISGVAAGILYGLIIVIGLILLIIPGIWIGIRLSMYSEAIVEKQLGPIEALKYSFALTKGNTLNLFGLFLVAGILAGLGFLLCGIGALWSFPLAGLMVTYAFLSMHGGPHFVVDSQKRQ